MDVASAYWHETSNTELLQVKALIEGIKASCDCAVEKIDRQALRKQAHQLADYCKTGKSSAAGLLSVGDVQRLVISISACWEQCALHLGCI